MLLIGAQNKVKAEERIRIACLLLQAGADPDATNDRGRTMMDVCQNDTIKEGVKRFLAEK